MIPTPGGQSEDGGRIIRHLLTEFLRGFSLRTLLFLLDLVLPQLDATMQGGICNKWPRGSASALSSNFNYTNMVCICHWPATILRMLVCMWPRCAPRESPFCCSVTPHPSLRQPRGISAQNLTLGVWNLMLWRDELSLNLWTREWRSTVCPLHPA